MALWQKIINLIINCDTTLYGILFTTLRMSIVSSVVSLIIGVPVGVFYGISRFKGKKFLIILNRTFMGLPPVVCGLICFMLFCGVGPLRHLKLLYTVEGMSIAQIMLITPIVIGTIEPIVKSIYPSIKETCLGLGVSHFIKFTLVLNECKYQILSTYLLAFSRAIAEVGAVSMVGGAIMYKTNVMTTAIMNYTNMGNFEMALALGTVLLVVSFVINLFFNLMIKK